MTRASAPSPQWEATPWPRLTPFLQKFTITPLDFPGINPTIEAWFNSSVKLLTNPIITLTPKKNPSTWTKGWWNPNISELQRIFHSVSISHKTRASSKGELKQAK
ncbi:hypothetical protein Q9L58_010305 [Maublancomyces gigas]|uniref:Uncharacterized protein n=1 Tax=Discina gigas TaxID=1032678 RepID=A0ABR3G4G3_9PEZI